MDPNGHAAIVTGAASGLGAATAAALAEAGAKVACLDLNLDGAKATAAKIGGIAVSCDVTSSDSAEAAVKEAAEKHGPARLLVNCAGIGPARRMVGRDGPMPLADFEKVIAINLTGTFNMMRLCAAGMQTLSPFADGERGVIVSTASVAAFDGQIGQPAYAASKGAVAAMTLPIARELARSLIRVMAIAPGIFETPMLAGLPQDAQDSLGQQVPHPARLGRPGEYANLVAHIVENAMLNGETIRLDGAIRMAPK